MMFLQFTKPLINLRIIRNVRDLKWRYEEASHWNVSSFIFAGSGAWRRRGPWWQNPQTEQRQGMEMPWTSDGLCSKRYKWRLEDMEEEEPWWLGEHGRRALCVQDCKTRSHLGKPSRITRVAIWSKPDRGYLNWRFLMCSKKILLV